MTSEEQPQHPIDAALEELSRVACLEWEPRTLEDRRISLVAKAVCKVRGDPYQLVTAPAGPACPPLNAGNGAIGILSVMPAWATYWVEAMAAVEAMDKADACPSD